MNNLFEEANADDEEEHRDGNRRSATDERLLEMLKELRQKEAKKKNLPPFVIFLETSLQDMATMYPTTLEELEKCQGVSKGKAVKFGKPFVELIAKYVEENNIERPDDFVMKSVVNKSGNKVYIIQNTIRKFRWKPLPKIKAGKWMKCWKKWKPLQQAARNSTLIMLLMRCWTKTTRNEIIDYFKSCETSSLQVAQEELAEYNFNWEQLKIMRIKFLSEYGM